MSFEPTADQIAKTKQILANYGQGFAQLPDEIKMKYAQQREADKGLDCLQTPEHLKTKEIFDATDANGDGSIDESEFPEFHKAVMAWRDSYYGGHVETDAETEQLFKELVFNISEPANSFTKDDLDFFQTLMFKVRFENL